MKLYFLRHGIAAEREGWSGGDAERPLTAHGRKCMEHEAKAIAHLGLQPDRIVTSPLKRAKETAQIVAARLGLENHLAEDERLAEGFDANALAEMLRTYGDVDCLMLVGHEPNFSRTIGQLIGGARVDLKKGGLARVDLSDATSRDGELVWLLPPKALGA